MIMNKKVLFLMAGALLSLSACKTSQSAYQQAYEKAVSGDESKAAVEAPVATATADDVANESVREEKVSVVSGDQDIKAYGIVCGSYSLKTNADALRESLVKDGYKAVVVVNEAGKTYRVICASFDTKEEAVTERNKFKARYPNNKDFQAAWLLYRK